MSEGNESKFMQELRERQLEAVIVTRCAICGVGKRASAKKGMEWFAAHKLSAKHKANVARRKANG